MADLTPSGYSKVTTADVRDSATCMFAHSEMTEEQFDVWLAEHEAEVIARHEAARELDRSVLFGVGVRNTGAKGRPDGSTDVGWHQEAIDDTGTSHTLPGRLYVVQCEWCPLTFAANTKAEAMAMFRAHEEEMLNG